MPAACSWPESVNSSDLSAPRVTYPSASRRPIISCTVGADTCIARAMFAPVIGRPGLLQPVDDLEVLLLGDGGLLLGHGAILAGAVRSDPTSIAAVQIGPGTRVLVTGASRGIGEAIARAFAKRGATLGLLARKREPLDELAAELPGDGPCRLVADVTDSDSIAARPSSSSATWTCWLPMPASRTTGHSRSCRSTRHAR